ncbi:MAG: hypothetical protein AAGG75_13510 [Bacteroidota bacterium]
MDKLYANNGVEHSFIQTHALLLKALTGHSPSIFFRNIRLPKGKILLPTGFYTSI